MKNFSYSLALLFGFGITLPGVTQELFTTLDQTLPVIESAQQADVTPPGGHVDKGQLSISDQHLKVLNFYRRRIPRPLGEVPESYDGERLYWKKGDRMRDVNLPAGTYSIVQTRSFGDGYFIRYLGALRAEGHDGILTDTFAEIKPGDTIVQETFTTTLPPISGDRGFIEIRSRSLGSVSAFIEPEQNEEIFFSGTRSFIAAKFFDNQGGNTTSLGANFVIKRNGIPIAKALVADADRDLATLYIYEADREVRSGDEIFVQ